MEHPALVYDGLEGFLEASVPYVAEGLRRDEAVFVATRGDYLAALRDEVGHAPASMFADTRTWHPHPATRLRAMIEMIDRETGGGARSVRFVGEPVWSPERPEMVREWQRLEAALNVVLAPHPVSLLCLYDATLPAPIIETARRLHPQAVGRRGPRRNRVFEAPHQFLRRWTHVVPAPPLSATHVAAAGDLGHARDLIVGEAQRAGVDPDRAADLALATNEILTNALLHAGSVPELWAWLDGGAFCCQVADRGPGIADPLAGYRPPAGGVGGYGLWLARQLVDLLQVDSTAEGTTIRLTVPVDGEGA